MTRRQEETKAVRKALADKGYKVLHVGHGTGTARCWLHIKVASQPECLRHETMQAVIRIAEKVTGRLGDYDGRINVDVS